MSMHQGDCASCKSDDASWSKAMEFFDFSVVSFTLRTAIKLKVFDVLAKHHPHQQLSAAQILSHIHDDHPPDHRNAAPHEYSSSSSSSVTSDRTSAISSLDRLLRLLASYSLLDVSVSLDPHGRPLSTKYGLTPASTFFIQRSYPNYDASLAPSYLLTNSDAFIQSWRHADAATLEGVSPFLKAHGKDLFTYVHDNPQFGQLFQSTMATHSNLIMQALLQVYHGFDGLSSIVDVGGASGACLRHIVSKYPRITAINFDQPHVIQAAPRYEGVQHVEGNMFDSIPQGEAIFMKWILHDWSDQECIKILKNCYLALPPNGKVIILDVVLASNIDTDIANRHGYAWDVLMLIQCPGGRERTMVELEDLARLAGPFDKVQLVCKVHELSVVEMHKA